MEKLKPYLGHLIVLIVAIVIFVILKRDQNKALRVPPKESQLKEADGNGSLYLLGRGSKDDSIETLLARINWSSSLYKRTERWERCLMITLFATFMLALIVRRKIPSIVEIVMTIIVIFFVIYMMQSFMYTHGDLYNDANLRSNVSLIASKLKLKLDFINDPPMPTNEAPDRTTIM